MADDESPELSPSGSPIYRHRPRSIPFQPAVGESDNISRITAHIERHIGPIEFVYHELISDLVHIDVHVVKPTPERNHYTLVTSGMSDAPMTVPEGAEEFRYAELLIDLPASWPIDRVASLARTKDVSPESQREVEEYYWPIRWLKALARMPHAYDTWLSWGHTVPTDDPPTPYAANTKLCCMLLMPPLAAPEEFFLLKVSPDKIIHFYSLLPIYEEEMNLKIQKGSEPLIELFDKYRISPIVDVKRRNVAARKKWLGLF